MKILMIGAFLGLLVACAKPSGEEKQAFDLSKDDSLTGTQVISDSSKKRDLQDKVLEVNN